MENTVNKFDPKLITRISDALTRTDRINIYLHSKYYEYECTKEEPDMGTCYSLQSIPDDLYGRMQNPDVLPSGKKTIDVPPENYLIPMHFDIKGLDPHYTKYPVKVTVNKDADVWYMQDALFKLPVMNVRLKIYTGDNGIGLSPEATVFINLWHMIQMDY